MKITVQVVLHADEDSQTAVREVFTLTREALAPDTVGLQLQEAKDLLAAVQDTVVEHQVAAALSAQAACPDCGIPHRHKDSRRIVVRTLFGVLRLDSPRWWSCPCTPRTARTFSPLAATLRERTTPELSYLQTRFAGLVSYGLSADLLNEIQQMRWSPRGAHLLLQIRTRVLNDTLTDDYRRWYPDFNRTPHRQDQAA